LRRNKTLSKIKRDPISKCFFRFLPLRRADEFHRQTAAFLRYTDFVLLAFLTVIKISKFCLWLAWDSGRTIRRKRITYDQAGWSFRKGSWLLNVLQSVIFTAFLTSDEHTKQLLVKFIKKDCRIDLRKRYNTWQGEEESFYWLLICFKIFRGNTKLLK